MEVIFDKLIIYQVLLSRCTDNQDMDNPLTASQDMDNQLTYNQATECHLPHLQFTEEVTIRLQQVQPSFISITTMTTEHSARCVGKRPPISHERKWDALHGLGFAAYYGQPDSFAGFHAAWMAAKTQNSSVFHVIMSRIISKQTVAERDSNDHYNFILIIHFLFVRFSFSILN